MAAEHATCEERRCYCADGLDEAQQNSANHRTTQVANTAKYCGSEAIKPAGSPWHAARW
jgi:hypothetical protein